MGKLIQSITPSWIPVFPTLHHHLAGIGAGAKNTIGTVKLEGIPFIAGSILIG
jgi:hypothetical protein